MAPLSPLCHLLTLSCTSPWCDVTFNLKNLCYKGVFKQTHQNASIFFLKISRDSLANPLPTHVILGDLLLYPPPPLRVSYVILTPLTLFSLFYGPSLLTFSNSTFVNIFRGFSRYEIVRVEIKYFICCSVLQLRISLHHALLHLLRTLTLHSQ
jgi:hypothetical protein